MTDDEAELDRRRLFMADTRQRHEDALAIAEAERTAAPAERRVSVYDVKDGLTLWRERHAERDRRREQADRERHEAEQRIIEQHSAASVATRAAAFVAERDQANQLQHNALRDAVGQVIGIKCRKLREDMAAEIGQVRADLYIARAYGTNA
jgi:hypothetical protein